MSTTEIGELPQSPVLLANLIRDHVPAGFSVVAIGGNRTFTRIELMFLGSKMVIWWDNDAWVVKLANGSIRVLHSIMGLATVLHEHFSGPIWSEC